MPAGSSVTNLGYPALESFNDRKVIHFPKTKVSRLRHPGPARAQLWRILEVLTIEYMSNEESVYEPDSNSEEEDQRRGAKLEKLIIKRHQWRSEELTREFQSLDRKANRARSDRGKRMMAKREVGGVSTRKCSQLPKRGPSMGPSGRFTCTSRLAI